MTKYCVNELSTYFTLTLVICAVTTRPILGSQWTLDKLNLQKPCIPRDFGSSSFVCVCNSTYCDELDSHKVIQLVATAKFVQIQSSLEKQRFQVIVHNQYLPNVHKSRKEDNKVIELIVDPNVKHQAIFGFGGAFTDAAGINLASVSLKLQENILKSYFGVTGLNYTFGRVPIAGTDFSTHEYTYDDIANDTKLAHFALTTEDYKHKIPFIQKAKQLQPTLKLLAAPWSAPKWMKTNSTNSHFAASCGFLQEKYYALWTKYILKFLDAYKSYNLTFWGLSTQNEPLDGIIPHFAFNCMAWTAQQQAEWIKSSLGPTLANSTSGYEKVKLVIFDDQRPFLNTWVKPILNDAEAAKYVAGIGLHWYADIMPQVSALDIAHSNFPNHFLLATEACTGAFPGEHEVLLGSWERAEAYGESIIQDLNHWVVGWIDWNLVLDLNGGPNWVKNYVDAPIIVDKNLDMAYKQPMFYMFGHFSKFIPEGSLRIQHELKSNSGVIGIEMLTVERPDGFIVIVVLNKLSSSVVLKVSAAVGIKNGKVLEIECGPRSIQTIVTRIFPM